ncbi:MAG: NADH-quinone oxidoreductase subunit N [Opitutales bacterium]
MNFENIKEFIPKSTDFLSVLPELSLLCFAMLVLLLAVVFEKHHFKKIGAISIIFTAISLSFPIIAMRYCPHQASGSYFAGTLGAFGFFTIFVFICAILTQIMAFRYLSKKPTEHKSEFFAVIMLSALSASILARAENFVLLFVALECFVMSLYAMVAWSRKSVFCLDGAMKYIIISGVSSAILLMGIALLYVVVPQDLSFASVLSAKAGESTLGAVALVMIFSGLLFKLGAFPFQFWVSDVYQSAPTPASAYLAVVSKGVGIFLILKLLIALGLNYANVVNVFAVIACLTILAGNMAGLLQRNVKRLLALSGVSNAGYLLLLICVALKSSELSPIVGVVLFFYLMTYAFSTYTLFGIINTYKKADDETLSFDDFRGMFKKDRITSGALVIALSSLAGIPPTAGFFAKLLIIILAFAVGLYIPLAIMLIGSAMSIYYYFAWIRAVFVDNEEPYQFLRSRYSAICFIFLSLATLLFGAVALLLV